MSRRDTAWPAGTPCWIDLMPADPDGARSFYVEVLGWSLAVGGPDNHGYAIAQIEGDAICGLHGMAAADGPGWVTYLASDDVDGTAAAIVDHGGSVVSGPNEISDQGRMLIATDPLGAVFGVWQAHGRIGCARVNEDGAFIWTELLTRDPDTAERFYADVFGVTFTPIGGDAFRFETMSVGENVVGGVGRADVDRSYWRTYFGADDVDAHVEQATRRGAGIVEPAHDSPFGRWAQLRDPNGATYCVITPPQTGP